MTAMGPHTGAARDRILPDSVGSGGDRDGDVWASPVARVVVVAGAVAMMVVRRGGSWSIVARGGNDMDIAAVEGTEATAHGGHGGHGLASGVVGWGPSP